jgi:aldehyde:ferredoxin oxidoreductase
LVDQIGAYAGEILRVDLSSKKTTTEPTTNYIRTFLGGRGINVWLLYNEVKPWIWPFDPANRLYLGAGVLTGLPIPGACRLTLESRSPLSALGGLGSANAGGHFAPELKFAGYDGLVIEGRSRNPCYLCIQDENVEIREKKDLWGKTTWETDDIIKEESGEQDIQIAAIGPAGENLVRAACIIVNRGRAAAKCGLGAVMGSKKLKAIAVKGTKALNVAKPDEFMRLAEEIWHKVNSNEYIGKELRPFGTSYVERGNELGDNPVRNFQDGFWDPEKVRRIGKNEVVQHSSRRLSCFSCPVACSFYLRVEKGEFQGIEGEGIEGNTQRNFGCRLDVDDMPALMQMHFLCNQYGLGEDETAGAIAWAMECYEKGVITEKHTEGRKLEWGDKETILELITKIAFREGFGELLGEGSWRASKMLGRGSEKYSMSIKGHDLYEPLRVVKAYALGSIVSPRGPCHLRGSISTSVGVGDDQRLYLIADTGNIRSYENKAKVVAYQENFKAIIDSLGLCLMVTQTQDPNLIDYEDISRILSAATGWDFRVTELLEIGERIHNVEKAFNARVGMTRRDDYPPWRFFEPIPSGPSRGECLERNRFKKLLDEYYQARGWNVRSGLPSKSKLETLGLSELARELESQEEVEDTVRDNPCRERLTLDG